MEPYRFIEGQLPLLVSMPHAGTHIPAAVLERMTEVGRAVPDTDWHIDRLYNFLKALGVSVLTATYSRFVIDLNRDPADKPLYPGASNTELCPTTTFAEEPIYRGGMTPSASEIQARRKEFWLPYHDRLRAELDRLKAAHGIAVLWEAHSIKSEVPRFFKGRLPDLNFGSGGGTTASSELVGLLGAVAREAEALGYSHIVDGRFKGGYSTRHYGDPAAGFHAVQLELSQRTYMDEEPPFAFRRDLAENVRPVLRGLLDAALAWAELEAPA